MSASSGREPRAPAELRTFVGVATVYSALLLALSVVLTSQSVGPVLRSPLGIDEQVTYYVACGRTPPSVFDRAVDQSATPPLYFWLVSGVVRLASMPTDNSPAEWMLRLPAFLAMLASVVVVYRLGFSWIGPGAGAAAAVIFAAHPQTAFWATQARPYAVGVLANLVATGCLVRLRKPGWSPAHLGGFVLADVCLLWTHYVFAVVLAAQLMLIPLADGIPWRESEEGRGPLSGAALTVTLILLPLTMVPLAPGIFRLIEVGPHLNWVTVERPWHAQLSLLAWKPLAWTLAAGLAVWLLRRWRRPNDESPPVARGKLIAALVIWFAVPIYALWLAGRYAGSALADPRYFAMQLGPAALLIAAAFYALAGSRWAWLLAILFVCLDGAPARVVDVVRQPVRHDRYWLDAALLLNERADDGDLVLVQSGLVETALAPGSYRDAGYQEYATCRLSDFYLDVDAQRLTLPLHWIDGPWLKEYAQRVRAACDAGHRVWLVISADNDFGQRVERSAVAWLRSLGLQPQVVSDERVARILQAHCPGESRLD